MDLVGDGSGMMPHLVPLPGGHSGETFLAEAAGERTVVRIYAARSAARGAHAAEVDAAVLRLVRGLLPAPEVLEVRRADPSAGTPALLVTSWIDGVRLEEVLPEADEEMAVVLGRNVAVLLARLAQMPMLRRGMFVDGDLRIEAYPPAEDLLLWLEQLGGSGPLAEWDEPDRAALAAVATRAQELLDRTTRACLVHSDFNPKNILVDPETGRVTGLVDWEHSHSGHPMTDLGNLLRFDRRPAYEGAVLSTYAERVPDAPSSRQELLDCSRAADLFALVELASRQGQNPVATRAHDLLLAIARAGDLAATP